MFFSFSITANVCTVQRECMPTFICYCTKDQKTTPIIHSFKSIASELITSMHRVQNNKIDIQYNRPDAPVAVQRKSRVQPTNEYHIEKKDITFTLENMNITCDSALCIVWYAKVSLEDDSYAWCECGTSTIQLLHLFSAPLIHGKEKQFQSTTLPIIIYNTTEQPRGYCIIQLQYTELFMKQLCNLTLVTQTGSTKSTQSCIQARDALLDHYKNYSNDILLYINGQMLQSQQLRYPYLTIPQSTIYDLHQHIAPEYYKSTVIQSWSKTHEIEVLSITGSQRTAYKLHNFELYDSRIGMSMIHRLETAYHWKLPGETCIITQLAQPAHERWYLHHFTLVLQRSFPQIYKHDDRVALFFTVSINEQASMLMDLALVGTLTQPYIPDYSPDATFSSLKIIERFTRGTRLIYGYDCEDGSLEALYILWDVLRGPDGGVTTVLWESALMRRLQYIRSMYIAVFTLKSATDTTTQHQKIRKLFSHATADLIPIKHCIDAIASGASNHSYKQHARTILLTMQQQRTVTYPSSDNDEYPSVVVIGESTLAYRSYAQVQPQPSDIIVNKGCALFQHAFYTELQAITIGCQNKESYFYTYLMSVVFFDTYYDTSARTHAMQGMHVPWFPSHAHATCIRHSDKKQCNGVPHHYYYNGIWSLNLCQPMSTHEHEVYKKVIAYTPPMVIYPHGCETATHISPHDDRMFFLNIYIYILIIFFIVSTDIVKYTTLYDEVFEKLQHICNYRFPIEVVMRTMVHHDKKMIVTILIPIHQLLSSTTFNYVSTVISTTLQVSCIVIKQQMYTQLQQILCIHLFMK